MPFSSSLSRATQTAKSAALVISGMASMARSQLAGEGVVLAFHGLRQDSLRPDAADAGLHLPLSIFGSLCQHLVEKYQVMPLAEMAAILGQGGQLPERAVALTFDDGYASNYEMAFPILMEMGLPATFFLTTGFLDRETPLWFQQADLAFQKGARVGECRTLGETLAWLKTLPETELSQQVAEMEKQTAATSVEDLPALMQPMTWSQARQMRDSGLVDFGGHTHTHPILARCGVEKQREEIVRCRDRIHAELDRPPHLFAYPNGGEEDMTAETEAVLREAGFDSAWTMMSGRARADVPAMMMPRYGAPVSVWEAEATVSGAFELLRQWRGGGT